MDENLRDRVVRLETHIEHLKENDLKLDKKIIELENKIMLKLDELNKNATVSFKQIEETLNQQKGGWKAITIIASVVVGVVSVINYLFKFFN
jgi:hypothetical protein